MFEKRKDLIYQYWYTDICGKRQIIYSSDLKELREKEKAIQKLLDDGIDYAAGKLYPDKKPRQQER